MQGIILRTHEMKLEFMLFWIQIFMMYMLEIVKIYRIVSLFP
jgi:hypothetical protein